MAKRTRTIRSKKRASNKRVGDKISKLRAEGKPQKQAIATAINMNSKGRLGPKGGYKRKGSK